MDSKETKEDLVFSHYTKFGASYGRSQTTNSEKLIKCLTDGYNVTHGFILPSGMSSIFTALSSAISTISSDGKKNILYGSQLFTQTPKVLQHLSIMYSIQKINLVKLDLTNHKEMKEKIMECKDQDNILFCETCSNPEGFIFPPELIHVLRSVSKTSLVIIDNTWLTFKILNPFEKPYHADCVVSSLTKYYSAGKAIAGCILTSNSSYAKEVEHWIKMTGVHVSPHDANVILNNISNLDERIQKASTNTILVLQHLSTEKIISNIQHPSITSHQDHTLAKEIFNTSKSEENKKDEKDVLWPSVFTCMIKKSIKATSRILSSQKFIEYKTSFGGELSRIDCFPVSQKLGKEKYTRIRISIGWKENIKELLKSFDSLFTL